MKSWERFDETSLPDKGVFYSESYIEEIIEEITDENYIYAQKVVKEFNLKNFVEYYDVYVQNDTLLLADVFENFRIDCIEIYGLDLAHFLSATVLASLFKKDKSKIRIINSFWWIIDG